MWGDQAQFDKIKRGYHEVGPFVRQLPAGQQPSQRARELAAMYGFILGPGETFVSPHGRGALKLDQETHPGDAVTIVRCKGLATVTWILEPYLENFDDHSPQD
jgi:hypothetical protein